MRTLKDIDHFDFKNETRWQKFKKWLKRKIKKRC